MSLELVTIASTRSAFPNGANYLYRIAHESATSQQSFEIESIVASTCKGFGLVNCSLRSVWIRSWDWAIVREVRWRRSYGRAYRGFFFSK
jgi:hypothetical protein